MRPFPARKRTMNALDTLNDARPVLRGLVQRAERTTGSRMAAYELVARDLKASASWLRKAIGNQPVAFPAHVYRNMVAAYDAASARMEAEAKIERERFLALGRNADAVAKGVVGQDGSPTSVPVSRPRMAAAGVAPLVGEGRR